VTLASWLDPLYGVQEIGAVDRWAIADAGVGSLDLMERAAEGLARCAAELAGTGRICVAVGAGNNGGDGLAAARILRADGRDVDVMAATALDELAGDARVNLERLPGPAPAPVDRERLVDCALVVDALLGTGCSDAPRGPIAAAIAAINEAAAPVLACDVPSGVNSSNGEVADEATRAALTATFHGSKIGLHVAPGAWHAGRVNVIDIGIPRGAPPPMIAGLISDRALDLVPRRTRSGSKFSSGDVVVAGGARGMCGAPLMSVLGALRSGAGYVQLAVPAALEGLCSTRVLEAVTRAVPGDDGAHVAAGVEPVLELADGVGALVLGPGIGRSAGALEFARAVAAKARTALVLDADALNAHAGALAALRGRERATVLTPHAGELARLLGTDSADIAAHRLESAIAAAQLSGAVVVLKGDDSLIAAPEGPVAVSPGATPALATAGTGDVLAGVIGALLAKGLGPFEAAAAAVLAHARAGRLAAARHGVDHTIATDVIDALPAAFSGRVQRSAAMI